MILGIGADLANIERIEGTLDRFGRRFVARVFTETEQAISERRAGRDGGSFATLRARWTGCLARAGAIRPPGRTDQQRFELLPHPHR